MIFVSVIPAVCFICDKSHVYGQNHVFAVIKQTQYDQLPIISQWPQFKGGGRFLWHFHPIMHARYHVQPFVKSERIAILCILEISY